MKPVAGKTYSKEALALFLYMGNTEPIKEWLDSEGVNTREQARLKLQSIGLGIAIQSLYTKGSSLAGMSNAIESIMKKYGK